MTQTPQDELSAQERLDAVIALHKPIEYDADWLEGGRICEECSGFDVERFPCRTVRAAGAA